MKPYNSNHILWSKFWNYFTKYFCSSHSSFLNPLPWLGGTRVYLLRQGSDIRTLIDRNLDFTFSLGNFSKPCMISNPHSLAKEYKVCILCYLILIKILVERNNIYVGLPKWHTVHPLLRSDFTSQFYISIWPDHEWNNFNYKCNALEPLKIAFIELHIGVIYLTYTDRYNKKWHYCVYYGVTAYPLLHSVPSWGLGK